MKKYGFHFLIAAVLTVAMFGACVSPFEGETPAEYDAQGRRLVTITVDLEDTASRAVNLAVAQAYIDFYEVVFESTTVPPEYYSATTTKGAGKRLSLHVPTGNYKACLYAGYLEKNGDAVLLAQDAITTPQDAATGTWGFSLTALNLQVNGQSVPVGGPPVQSTSTDPIFVETGTAGVFSGELLNRTPAPDGIPYYALTGGYDVKVTVDTGVTTLVAIPPLITPTIEVISIARKEDKPPVIVDTTSSSPTFATGNGKLTFNFTAPSGKGISNIGFDVEGMAIAAIRNNGSPVRWHIRNGIDVRDYDNGENNITNSGAGILFAFGGAVPAAKDVFIGFAPPPGP